MKTKKLIPLCALALSISLLSGCAATSKVDFTNYWDVKSLVSNSIDETLVYDVTFEKGSSTLGYEIAYSNGRYTTHLVHEDGTGGYTYTTNFSINVTYTLGEESKILSDSVETTVVFATAKEGLYPISSQKKFVSHSPSASTPTNVDGCYRAFEYQIDTTYSNQGNTCTIVKDGNEETKQTKTFKTSGSHRYLDNEQLLFAPRGISSGVTSGKFLSYSPFVDRVQTVNFAFGDATSADFTFDKNGTETTQTIAYRPYQMQLNGNNPGGVQTAWYASLTSTSENENRNVMLRLETPLSYSLGKLVYTLRSASYN